ALSRAYLVSYFVAGGAAGAASRTVVSPLERLKIIMQIQPHEKPSSAGGGSAAIPSKAARASGGSKGAYAGVWSGLVKMWREEGMAGFMRGNGINCLRIAPYSAVQFSSYEVLKNLFLRSHYLAVWERLTAGALAGIASVVSTYPLDLVRSRISIASASLYSEAKAAEQGRLSAATGASSTSASTLKLRAKQKRVPGIWAMTLKVYREEGGVRGLYRGCVPTSAGVAPYVSLNFIGYETLRERFEDDEGRISDLSKLGCGAAAGSVSQTLTYPLDVLRRRLQVAGMRDSQLGYSDTTSFGVFRTIVRQDGVRGLYRGLWPNLLKVAPSIGVSFWTYETVRSWLEPHHHHATGHH
ncbi:mitochondrial carrier, partial [Tilletiaria anomala UBC 951]